MYGWRVDYKNISETRPYYMISKVDKHYYYIME